MLRTYDIEPSLAVRLVAQMSRVRILFTLALLVGLYTAQREIIIHPTAAYAGVALIGLLAIYSYFAANWQREHAMGRLDLTVALTVMGDVFALSLFIYGTGGAYAHFFILLLCDVVFAAYFFSGLELVFIVGIVCGAYATVAFQVQVVEQALWYVLTGLTSALVLTWLANGVARVLEFERLSKERIIRHLSAGVCLLSGSGRVLLANPHLERLSGIPVDHVVGEKLESLLKYAAGGQLARLFEGLQATIASGEAEDVEIGVITPEPMVVLRSAVPCLSSSGAVTAWVVVWQDMAEMPDLVKARAEGLELVTHEIRSGVSNLSILVQVLQGVTGDLDEEKREQVLDHLSAHADHLAGLVSSMMDLARFDDPEFRLERTPLDIRPMLEAVTATFAARCEQAELTFVSDYPDELPTIWADEDRLQEVFINLWENAMKYTLPGGIITFSARQSDSTLQCSVADSGVGIAPELHERIFEKFVSGPRSPKEKGSGLTVGGLGLGLALAKRIVELHDGSIELESALHEGATFTVTLPLGPPREPEEAPDALASS